MGREAAEEGGRILAALMAGMLEDASAYAVDDAIAPLAEKAAHLEKTAADLGALASALRVLSAA